MYFHAAGLPQRTKKRRPGKAERRSCGKTGTTEKTRRTAPRSNCRPAACLVRPRSGVPCRKGFPAWMRTAGRSSGSWALKRAPDRPSHSRWNSGRWPGRWPTRRRSRTGLITRFPFHSDRLNTCRSVLYKKVRKANRSGPAAGKQKVSHPDPLRFPG